MSAGRPSRHAEDEASFRFEPSRLQVPAGGEAHAAATVSAPPPRSGRERERRLTVFAEGAEQTLSGYAVFVQSPALVRSVLTAVYVVGLLILGNDGAGAGLFVALLASLLAVAAGFLTTGRS